jgi:hypothetical protein
MPAVAPGPQTLKQGMPAVTPGPQTLRDGAPVVGASALGVGGTPTLKDGMPVVGLPTPVNATATAGAAAAELLRSRGTALGHALSGAAGDQGRLPISLDDRMKGTLLGHTLHLPDLPAVEDDARPAESRPIAPPAKSASVSPFATEPMPVADFPRGDSRVFDVEPEAAEPEGQSRRGKTLARAAIFLAVLSICLVSAIAWVRVRRGDGGPPVPVEVHVAPPAEPPALDNPGAPPAGAAPTEPTAGATPPGTAPGAAEPAQPHPIAAEPAIAPPPVPAPTGLDEPRPAGAATAPRAKIKRHEAAAAGAAKPTAPRAAHAAPSPANPKSPSPGKRTKDEDPDGTLPLTE